MTSTEPASAAGKVRIAPGDTTTYVISLIDVAPDQHDDVLTLTSEGHADAMGRTPGFEGGVVLANERRERIVTYTFWDSPRSHLACLLDEENSAHARRAAGLADQVRSGSYDLFGTRSADGTGVFDIVADPNRAYFAIWGQGHSETKRTWILDYNLWETDRLISELDGFGFVAFFRGHDKHDFAEITSWETTDHFRAAFADPGFQEHIPPNNHYCEKDNTFDLRAVAVAGS